MRRAQERPRLNHPSQLRGSHFAGASLAMRAAPPRSPPSPPPFTALFQPYASQEASRDQLCNIIEDGRQLDRPKTDVMKLPLLAVEEYVARAQVAVHVDA